MQEDNLEEISEEKSLCSSIKSDSNSLNYDSCNDFDFIDATIEALLFASGEPLSMDELCQCSKFEEKEISLSLERLFRHYSVGNHGVELVKVAGKYQLRTKLPFAPVLRELKASRPRKLSLAALETLAIIAYRQPIVKSDIEKIRGVDVTPTLKTLLDRGLIRIAGHQATVGQPALYATTEEFLKLFSLESLSQLPSIKDISEILSDPGESGEQDVGVESAS